jgi:hypothetical protein
MRPKSMPRYIKKRKKEKGFLTSPLYRLVGEERLGKKCLFRARTLEVSITNSFNVANYILKCNMKKDSINYAGNILEFIRQLLATMTRRKRKAVPLPKDHRLQEHSGHGGKTMLTVDH